MQLTLLNKIISLSQKPKFEETGGHEFHRSVSIFPEYRSSRVIYHMPQAQKLVCLLTRADKAARGCLCRSRISR